MTINRELTKPFFTFIMRRKRGLWFPLLFPPTRKLPKHFDELYPLSATPFVFLSLCVREHVNSHLIDWKHASLSHTHTPPPCTHHRKETAMHTNKHVKFVERQAQNCIFSFLTRLRVRWARNKWDADRRLSHCLFALCPGQSYVYVCRGMGRYFDVFAIYSKSSVVKACWIFKGEVLRVNFVARVFTDNPSTESTPSRYSLGRTIRAHDSTDHAGYGYEMFIRTCC